MPDHIFHLCTLKSWQAQEESDIYKHNSLDTEGFIHASKQSQVAGVLNRYFDGVAEIVQLEIDVKQLKSLLKYEMATIGEEFPHIFGPINKSAIINVKQIR